VSIVEHNVVLVYVTLAAIFFSETGLVFMAFLRATRCCRCRCRVGPAAAQPRPNVYLLMGVITGRSDGNSVNYAIGAWLGRSYAERFGGSTRPRSERLMISTSVTAARR